MKRNPQARAAEAVRQTLLVWRHWDNFMHHRHRKPWMWGHPILAPKPKPGRFNPGPKFLPPYRYRKEGPWGQARDLRVVRSAHPRLCYQCATKRPDEAPI